MGYNLLVDMSAVAAVSLPVLWLMLPLSKEKEHERYKENSSSVQDVEGHIPVTLARYHNLEPRVLSRFKVKHPSGHVDRKTTGFANHIWLIRENSMEC